MKPWKGKVRQKYIDNKICLVYCGQFQLSHSDNNGVNPSIVKSNPTYVFWKRSSLLSTFHEAFTRDALSPFCYMNILLVQFQSVFFKSQMLVVAIVLSSVFFMQDFIITVVF